MVNLVKRPEMRHPPVAINCRCDGNQVSALIGTNYMEGVAGFGDDLPSALRNLADELEKEVGQMPVWKDINPLLQVLEKVDNSIGTHGSGPKENEEYYCEHCHVSAPDYNNMEHDPYCLVLTVRKAISENKVGKLSI